MRIYKRGSMYWFELVYKGERIQKTSGVKNRRVAGEIASAYHTALARGEVGIIERKKPPMFSEAMKRFLAWSAQEHSDHPATARRYRVSSTALLKAFKSNRIDQITVEDVEVFKSSRATEKGKRTKRRIRPATVNRELACLRAMFNHTIKGHPEVRNPVSVNFLAENNQQERVLSFSEQRAYLAKATPFLGMLQG